MSTMTAVPVLEIGGSHVTAALVDLETQRPLDRHDLSLPLQADREELLEAFLTAGRRLAAPPEAVWGVAIPGPFDYQQGIGRFERVAKFEALNGVDVGAALRTGLPAAAVRFLNDADAFGVGEVTAGAARGHRRAVCLTLGTGIGSSFLTDGYPVKSGDLVPPDGFVHPLRHQGRDLEDWMSRRALRRAYQAATGRQLDVIDIARQAREGDPAALNAWREGLTTMAQILAPWIRRFEADIVVIGGAIARAWDLIGPLTTEGFAAAGAPVEVVPAGCPDDAALLGAAQWTLAY